MTNEYSPENEVPRERRNLRNAVAFSPADEAWWQEYGVAIEAFHDTIGAGRKPLSHD